MYRRYPRYPDDSDYQTNAPSYYEDLARKNKLIKKLAKRIWEYDKILADSLEEIEEVLRQVIDKIGDGFNEEIYQLLVKWVEDGTLDHIINETLMNKKADKSYVDKLHENVFKNYGLFSRKVQKPSFTWVDDDGNIGFYNRYKEIMEEFNVRFTASIPHSLLNRPNTMTEKQLKEMISFGCEVVSHGYYHDGNDRPTTWSTERFRNDVKLAKDYIQSIGGNPNFYVVPFGSSTPAMRNIMSEYHIACIQTTTPNTDGGTYNTVNDFDNTRIYRISSSAPIEYIKQQISEAYQNNGWVIMMSHVNSDGADDEKVREILRHVFIVGLDYVNLQEGFNRFGNLAQFGTYKGDETPLDAIRADGSMEGVFNQVQYYTLLNDVPPNAPLDFFERETYSIFQVNSPTALNDYGLPSAGTIEVIRPFYNEYAFQRWTRYQGSETLVRSWNEDNEEWNDWDNATDKGITLNRTFNITLQPNSSYKITTEHNQTQGKMIFTQPLDVSNLPNGFSWNVMILEDGNIQHNFHNMSNSEVVLDGINWVIRVF